MAIHRITRKSKTKNLVKSLYKCRDCKRQFSATVGTIFEDSKISPIQVAGSLIPDVFL